VGHLIFERPLTVFVWSVIKEGMRWERSPKSVKEFNDEYLFESRDKYNGVLFFLFETVCWMLCLNRND
jgi:hypothetical protein